MQQVSKSVLIKLYCETQDAEAEQIAFILGEREQNNPSIKGWFIAECHMLDSGRAGERTLVCYGPGCTFSLPPATPFSPRGLASDMSVVTHYCENDREVS